jgi:Tfp pilus assembly protein PilF
MYFRNEQVDRALEAIEKFIETNRTFVPAFTFLSYAYCEYMEDYEKAISLINDNKSNFQNDIYILNNLAYAYLMNNNVERAKNILQTVADINDNVYLIATRGLLEIKEGNIARGRELYNNAMNLAGNERLRIQIQQKKDLELAKYFLSKGQSRDANNFLQKVITSKGGTSVYKDQCRRLLNRISLS